jgi:hypothetical protein
MRPNAAGRTWQFLVCIARALEAHRLPVHPSSQEGGCESRRARQRNRVFRWEAARQHGAQVAPTSQVLPKRAREEHAEKETGIEARTCRVAQRCIYQVCYISHVRAHVQSSARECEWMDAHAAWQKKGEIRRTMGVGSQCGGGGGKGREGRKAGDKGRQQAGRRASVGTRHSGACGVQRGSPLGSARVGTYRHHTSEQRFHGRGLGLVRRCVRAAGCAGGADWLWVGGGPAVDRRGTGCGLAADWLWMGGAGGGRRPQYGAGMYVCSTIAIACSVLVLEPSSAAERREGIMPTATATAQRSFAAAAPLRWFISTGFS